MPESAQQTLSRLTPPLISTLDQCLSWILTWRKDTCRHPEHSCCHELPVLNPRQALATG